MEQNLLAIAYLEEKEKALEQRKTIDLELKPALKDAEKDKSPAGKVRISELEAEIQEAEDLFKQIIDQMQTSFSSLFPYLEGIGAIKTNPYLLHYQNKDYGFYIDDKKNIHYFDC